MIKERIVLLITAFLLLGLPSAFADKFNTESGSEVRALGMGNAGINLLRGGYGAFYNPANIASKETGAVMQLTNFQLDGDAGFYQLLVSGQSINILNLASQFQTLQNNPGKFESARFSYFPNITFRDFSIGMLYEVNQGAGVRASDGDLIVKARDRFAPVASLSLRLFKGILRVGGSIQYETVGDTDTVIPTTDFLTPVQQAALDYKTVMTNGTGLNSTAGVTLTGPFRFLPSVSAVARNIGGTRYTRSAGVRFGLGSAPPNVPMTLDLAGSFTVYLARRLEMKNEIDYRDYTNKLQGGMFRHIFYGAEFLVYDMIRLRAGMMHGYPTAGLGLHTRKADLDFAWYSEELEDRLRGRPDPHFVMQYKFNFFGGTK